MLKVVHEESESNLHVPAAVGGSLLDELARDGARQMLAAALLAEVAAYVEAHAGEVDENGHRLVVRNGFHDPRRSPRRPGRCRCVSRGSTTSASTRPPGSGSGSPRRSCPHGRGSPRAWPRCCRCSTCTACPPVTSCPRWSSSSAPAAGLSAATVTRLTAQWQDDAKAFGNRSLAESDYVYLWVDGIHLKVRLEQDKVCLLVMIGVRVDGTKELVALADGFRESAESWADLLRDCKRRGMRAPVLAVGDGALGFWKALREVFPDTRSSAAGGTRSATSSPPCRSRRTPARRRRWRRSTTPRTSTHAAKAAAKAFAADYGAKWPKAVAKIIDDLDVLLAFYDFPAEHWIHLRTTNPIESTFATVRLRTGSPRAPAPGPPAMAMAFKLIESAQTRWRAVNAPHLVALVRAGATLQERQTRRTTRRPARR